ncbi:MAG: pilus assembly FimT family protein [Desulfovibrio sp.]|uniref:pilus assembly FimT family protein n=1 Tax=Desulfovibrio sp. 7SRBS1 TaxID=3378064 RepID=UPI003B3EB522
MSSTRHISHLHRLRFFRRETGFTFIELIAVMLILGIMAFVAIPRMFSTSQINAAAESEALKLVLRYAQTRAMSDIVPWGVVIEANKYTLYRLTSPSTKESIPGTNSSEHTFPSGVSATPRTIQFDPRGRPVNGQQVLTANQTVTVNGSGKTITITQQTGFIP